VKGATGIALLALVSTLVTVSPASSQPTCGASVLADWEDGRIDGVYPVACYREALKSLPEDVRVYTSAADDIARARRASVTAKARTRRTSGHVRPAPSAPAPSASAAAMPALEGSSASGAGSLPLPILLAVTVVVVVGAAGATSLLAERRRRSRLARGRAAG
jgi:hypothetical protein